MKKSFLIILCFLINGLVFSQSKPTSKPTTKPKNTTTKPAPKPKELKPIEPEQETVVEDGIVIATPPTFVKNEPPKKYDYTTSDLAVKWHELIFDLIEQTNNYTPNVAARTMSYINLAFYESISPAFPEYISLEGQIQGFEKNNKLAEPKELNAAVSANAALFRMTDLMFVSAPYIWMEKVYALNDSVNNQLSKNISAEVLNQSKLYGEQIADWVYEYSKSDGGHQAFLRTYDMKYKLSNCIGCFQINRVADLENTGPLHPNWGKNRTFIKENSDSVQVKPKVEFSHYQNSAFYKMAMEVYNISKQVTAGSEKAQIANFWDDAANYTYTAAGHSMSILTQVLKQNPTTIDRAAELFSNLSIAINDAFIVTWRLKYQYNLIRPITYIKRYIDSKWEPTLLTPPFPEFPSGHSAQTATMATLLTKKVGDNQKFIDYSKFFVGPEKTYNSFWEAAKECSISRVYGGIHFRDGIEQGEEVGKIVANNALKLKYKK